MAATTLRADQVHQQCCIDPLNPRLLTSRQRQAALPLMTVATTTNREFFGEVQVRSGVMARGEWSPEEAIGLLDQGYSVDRVVALTGYHRRWVAAQRRRGPEA